MPCATTDGVLMRMLLTLLHLLLLLKHGEDILLQLGRLGSRRSLPGEQLGHLLLRETSW